MWGLVKPEDGYDTSSQSVLEINFILLLSQANCDAWLWGFHNQMPNEAVMTGVGFRSNPQQDLNVENIDMNKLPSVI